MPDHCAQQLKWLLDLVTKPDLVHVGDLQAEGRPHTTAKVALTALTMAVKLYHGLLENKKTLSPTDWMPPC